MPDVQELRLGFHSPGDSTADIEPVISALNGGVAFQVLRLLSLGGLSLQPPGWGRLLNALAAAPCAAQLTSLAFPASNMCPTSMATFATGVALL